MSAFCQGVGAVSRAVLGGQGGVWQASHALGKGGSGRSGQAPCCFPVPPRQTPTLTLSRWLCSLVTEFIPGSYFPPSQRKGFSQHLTWISLAEIKIIHLYPFYRCQGEQSSPSNIYAFFKTAALSCNTALFSTTVGLILASSLQWSQASETRPLPLLPSELTPLSPDLLEMHTAAEALSMWSRTEGLLHISCRLCACL